VVLVTSSVPGEGKSTTALLVAASWATAKGSVLLVDCDLRRKTVSNVLGLAKLPGWRRCWRASSISPKQYGPTARPAIDVIAAGYAEANPADLLNSERLRELLVVLRRRYDHIVLDASPLLPVVDATVLARLVDQVLLIVEWKRTRRSSVLEATKANHWRGWPVVGVVLNKVDFPSPPVLRLRLWLWIQLRAVLPRDGEILHPAMTAASATASRPAVAALLVVVGLALSLGGFALARNSLATDDLIERSNLAWRASYRFRPPR